MTCHQFGMSAFFPQASEKSLMSSWNAGCYLKLRWRKTRTRKGCTRCLACRGGSNRRGQEKGEDTLEDVSKLSSLASAPWSVRCHSSLVTVRRINYFTAFRWIVKNPPVSSTPGLTVNGACELSRQLTPDFHQLDGWTRPWGRPGITFRAPHSVLK